MGRNIWRSARRFIYKRILHADDTPHRIALGVGISTFVGFSPTMGLQTVISIGLAALCRANKAVCLPFVWITNPVTFVPIYWSCWRLGAFVTGSHSAAGEAEMMDKLNSFSSGGGGVVGSIFSFEFWKGIGSTMLEMGIELWIGTTIVGLVSGVILYFVTKSVTITYRAKRQERMIHKHEKRRLRLSARKAARVASGELS